MKTYYSVFKHPTFNICAYTFRKNLYFMKKLTFLELFPSNCPKLGINLSIFQRITCV